MEDVTKLLHKPVLIISATTRLKNTYVDLNHFYFKYISRYFGVMRNSLEPQKALYYNNAEGKTHPSLT